jgi:hypothetical protein
VLGAAAQRGFIDPARATWDRGNGDVVMNHRVLLESRRTAKRGTRGSGERDVGDGPRGQWEAREGYTRPHPTPRSLPNPTARPPRGPHVGTRTSVRRWGVTTTVEEIGPCGRAVVRLEVK